MNGFEELECSKSIFVLPLGLIICHSFGLRWWMRNSIWFESLNKGFRGKRMTTQNNEIFWTGKTDYSEKWECSNEIFVLPLGWITSYSFGLRWWMWNSIWFEGSQIGLRGKTHDNSVVHIQVLGWFIAKSRHIRKCPQSPRTTYIRFKTYSGVHALVFWDILRS